MVNKIKNDKKNKVIILSLVAFVLILLGITGYLFVQQPSNGTSFSLFTTNPQADLTEEPTQDSLDQQPTNSQSFKIPELGIQIMLPEGLTGLKYEMQDTSYTNNKGENVERSSPAFTTQELVAGDSRCTFGSIGTMLKVSRGTITYGGDPKVDLENFSIILNRPQSGCTDKENVGKVQNDQLNLLISALQSARAI